MEYPESFSNALSECFCYMKKITFPFILSLCVLLLEIKMNLDGIKAKITLQKLKNPPP